jgi:hypothetical protein
VVEEAFVTGGVGLRTLREIEQEAEPLPDALGGEVAEEDAALDDHGKRRERHAAGRDARRGVRVGLVADEPVVGVSLVQIVEDRRELQKAEVPVA